MWAKALTLCILVALAVSKLVVDRKTSWLMDEYGRFRFIHGMNEVYKEAPYHPNFDSWNVNTSLTDEDFVNLRNWGFNSLRLYIAWEGFEPIEGQYNYTYLEQLKKIVRKGQQHNISVLLDAHHDLYSKRYCGQGFPTWITPVRNFPFPVKIKLRYDSEGNPLKQDCLKKSFGLYYMAQDVNIFQHQFFTKSQLNDKLVNMWVAVASYFKGDPNIIGYEMVNQPSGSNGYRNIYETFGPGVSTNKYMLPFYKKASIQLRKVDQQKLFVFQPALFDMFGSFDQAPSDSKYQHLDVMSHHVYPKRFNSHFQPQGPLFLAQYDQRLQIYQRQKNARQLKIGSMITEFGNIPQTPRGLKSIEFVVDYAEQHWSSWYYWQYKYNADSTCTSTPYQHSLYNLDGSIQTKKVKLLSIPYAYAVCGTPLRQSHSASSYSLSLIPANCKEGKNTEIFINEDMYFPKGFNVEFVPKCPECKLKYISKSYYQIIAHQESMRSSIDVHIVGYI